MHGADVVDWNPEIELLTQLVFTMQIANWQRAGGKGGKPRPVVRPGTEVRTGGTTRDPAQVRALLSSYEPEVDDV